MTHLTPFLVLTLGAACAVASANPLQLVGEVEPPLENGIATVSAVQSPFYAETRVRQSRFAFRNLHPDGYTLTVMDPEWGVTRTTVQVTPSLADPQGRVRVKVRLQQTDQGRSRRIQQQGSVSAAALQVSPKAKAALRRAHSRLGRGDTEAGIALLEKAVRISPSYAEAWNVLGTISYKAGRYDEAEERFRKALQHEPLNFAPLVNLGGVLLSLGRYEEALSFNVMARSMQPEDALANSQLGMSHFYKGQFQRAREYLLRAKEADPAHFSYPQLFLAEIYAKQGDLDAACKELEEVLRLHPDSGVVALAEDALRQLEAMMPPR